MRKLAAAAVTLVTLAFATAGSALPLPVRWGMTPDEVASVVPQAKPVGRPERMDVGVGRHGTELAVYGQPGRATLFYGDSGLSLIAVDVPADRCSRMVSAIVAERGRPIRLSDQVILKLAIWHDEPDETRVRVQTSKGVCVLNYEPLASYRDIDLREAAKRTSPR